MIAQLASDAAASEKVAAHATGVRLNMAAQYSRGAVAHVLSYFDEVRASQARVVG